MYVNREQNLLQSWMFCSDDLNKIWSLAMKLLNYRITFDTLLQHRCHRARTLILTVFLKCLFIFFANNNHSLSSAHSDHQAKHIYDKPCLKAPMAIMSFGSTHGCDDMLLFALPLSACQSILPIKLTDNFMGKPLNAQATAGRGSIMNTVHAGWRVSQT